MLKEVFCVHGPQQWRKLSLLVVVFYLFNLLHCDLLFYMLVFINFYRFPRIKRNAFSFYLSYLSTVNKVLF